MRLIGKDGENIGVVSIKEALNLAYDANLDLVEISPNAKPPVCKIMDLGKYKFEQSKREAEAKKKQKTVEIKEIKFRPNTDTHDYDVKMRAIRKFIEADNKVKVTMRFRGRELAHQRLGLELLDRVKNDMGDMVNVDQAPKLEGRQMMMLISPSKGSSKKAKSEDAPSETKEESTV